MEIIINETAEEASIAAARIIAQQIKNKPDSVIGLATGSTPVRLYQELIRQHKEEGLDFSQVTTFNLDEYVGLPPTHPQSYHHFMQEQLFQHLNIKPENHHIPNGMAQDIPKHCADYEAMIEEAGGIDIQILGIGSDGHIAFNEPTSSLASRTRIKSLTEQTVQDNARFFDGDESEVPVHCITMGIGTIMESRMTILLAFGEGKAQAIADTVEGPVAAMVPASILQHHPKAKIFIDQEAAKQLQKKSYYQWVYQKKPNWQKNDSL